MEDLNRANVCEATRGGVVPTILVALKDDVDHWPSKLAPALRNGLVDHVETVAGDNMTMKAGKRFFKIEIKKGSAELKYALQGESGSRNFRSTLQIYAPALRAALLGFMSATANQELIILAQTAKKEWHMLGDEDEGCEYDSGEATSGKVGTDPHGADLTFYTDCAAPTIYKGDVASLLLVSGTAPTIVIGAEVVSGTSVTLKATATENDSSISSVGFRYKAEGATTWTNVSVSSFTSGTEFSKNVTGLTAGDYLYYAYMVVDGHEAYTETYAFTIA